MAPGHARLDLQAGRDSFACSAACAWKTTAAVTVRESCLRKHMSRDSPFERVMHVGGERCVLR